MAARAVYAVTGGFIGLESGVVPEALSFESVEDENYSYEATVTAGGYSVNLRDGAYIAKATVTDYKTSTHVVVEQAEMSKDIFFEYTKKKTAIPLVKDIYVGYPDKDNNYDTVTLAMEACELMAPQSEDDRITVHIAPGTYRDQIFVKAPYITFTNDDNCEVLLTWYYGTDYKYFSAGTNGFYNAALAHDKYDKNKCGTWGTAVYVDKAARGFRASGITFENSFNRYITQEELDDGVELAGTEGNTKLVRKKGVDVQAKTSTERATAICNYATNVEFENCTFLGSQDTVFTGNSNTQSYFKNCFIEGMTDYIFGDGDVVFDACELSFKGYSSGAQGGYITAARHNEAGKGYLFRNCSITANKKNKLTVPTGYLGRPWGASAKVMYLNTYLGRDDLIAADGWYSMGGVSPETVEGFLEYGTMLSDTSMANLSNRKTKNTLSASGAAAVDVKSYFGDWTPSFYRETADDLKLSGPVSLLDNGDINTPYPGHTLTVAYSLGDHDAEDVSVIRWYGIKDGASKLLASSIANTGKSYKLTSEDVGYVIKAEVTPKTLSGKTFLQCCIS